MPNNKKRVRLSAEKRRQQLLSFAVSTTAKNGIGNAKHTEIAELSGVAVSTVFFYFPTVEILNSAVLDALEELLAEISLERVYKENPNLPLIDLIEIYFSESCDILLKQPDYAVIFLEWGVSINNDSRERYKAFRSGYIALISKILKQIVEKGNLRSDLNLQDTAIMLIAVLITLLRMKFFDDSKGAITEIFTCLDNYFHN